MSKDTKLICKIPFKIKHEKTYYEILKGDVLKVTNTYASHRDSNGKSTNSFLQCIIDNPREIERIRGYMHFFLDIQTASFCCEEYSEEQPETKIIWKEPYPPYNKKVLLKAIFNHDNQTFIFQGGYNKKGWHDWSGADGWFDEFAVIGWAELPK